MAKSVKELRERLADEVAAARAILDGAKDGMTEEVRAAHKTALDKAAATRAEIDTIEAQEEAERALDRPARQVRAGRHDVAAGRAASEEERKARDELRTNAFRTWLRVGEQHLAPEAREALSAHRHVIGADEVRAGLPPELRDLATSTGGSPYAGYTIPTTLWNEINVAMKAYGGMLQAARPITTARGETLNWPGMDNTGNKAVITSEANQTTSSTDPVFSNVAFGAFTYRSLIKASLELLQDSEFDLDDLVRAGLAEQLGRGLNEHFTTGNGSTQPGGVVTRATLGKTLASATAVTHNELLDLQHSVDPAYRASPNCRWMFHDNILKALRQLKDSQGRPLLTEPNAGAPGSLLGYPFTINQDMASSLAAGNKPILFGDFSKYIIRNVANPILVRLQERYADYGQVGFMLFSRHDGELLTAGTPIKYALCGSA